MLVTLDGGDALGAAALLSCDKLVVLMVGEAMLGAAGVAPFERKGGTNGWTVSSVM